MRKPRFVPPILPEAHPPLRLLPTRTQRRRTRTQRAPQQDSRIDDTNREVERGCCVDLMTPNSISDGPRCGVDARRRSGSVGRRSRVDDVVHATIDSGLGGVGRTASEFTRRDRSRRTLRSEGDSQDFLGHVDRRDCKRWSNSATPAGRKQQHVVIGSSLPENGV